MEKWYNYWREYRRLKLEIIGQLESGRVTTSMTVDGIFRDTTNEEIERQRREISEIEAMFRDAGEAL